MEATYGLEASNKLFVAIDNLIINSLKAVQNVMINDRHCFECYGYDVLIDQDLKPWLVEVNASPSLSTTTDADRVMKYSLLKDIYSIVAAGVPAQVPDTCKSLYGAMGGGSRTAVAGQPAGTFVGQENTRQCQNSGGFYVLYDEATETATKAEQAEGKDDDKKNTRGLRVNNGVAEWR